PAIAYIGFLPFIREVTASGGALDGQMSNSTWGHLVALVVDDLGAIALNGNARGPRAGVAFIVGNENMQHFGGTDTIDELDAGGRLPEGAGCCRQYLACGNAFAQGRAAQGLAVLGH